MRYYETFRWPCCNGTNKPPVSRRRQWGKAVEAGRYHCRSIGQSQRHSVEPEGKRGRVGKVGQAVAQWINTSKGNR